MQLTSAYSTTATTSTNGSTRGFLSFSSQSIIEGSSGPSFIEKMHTNVLHLSLNIHRYKGFPSSLHNFASYFHLVQLYCLILHPSKYVFWNKDSSSNLFRVLARIPLQFCFVSFSESYICYSMIIQFAISALIIIYYFYVLAKNPLEKSYTNTNILVISIISAVIVPIFITFAFSNFGYLLNAVIFNKNTQPLVLISMICGLACCILYTELHYLSIILYRGSTKVDFTRVMYPWAQYNQVYAHMQYFILILVFIEEFFPTNEQNWFIGVTAICFVLANPLTIIMAMYFPMYQNFTDSKHITTLFSTVIVVNICFYINDYAKPISGTVLFIITLTSILFFYILYGFILKKFSRKYTTRLYSVYKNSNPVLPPTTPAVFNKDQQQTIPLSQEAYQVTQAFNSLDISGAREFHNMLACGARARMPAVRNIDFIKWGLNTYNDNGSVIMCTQICHYFEEFAQTQSVLLSRTKEIPDLPIFIETCVNAIDHDHTDIISDAPQLYKMLEKKARGSMMRCRRSLALFWGCVLKHSQVAMKEDLCRLRDVIADANMHFDELMRCYPMSLNAIALYLSFLTEIKGSFKECYYYINDVSSKFIEQKSEQINDDGQSTDGISILLKDSSQPFQHYTSNLSMYIEQERRVKESTKGPQKAIWTLSIISFITIIGCMIFVIAYTLVTFQVYPKLLDIVSNASDIVIDICTLTLASRRLCLYSRKQIPENTFSDRGPFDDNQTLLAYVFEKAAKLPEKTHKFYVSAVSYSSLVEKICISSSDATIFREDINASFSYLIDFLQICVMNIITNISSRFKTMDQKGEIFDFSDDHDFGDIEDYEAMCQSREMEHLIANVNSLSTHAFTFVDEFQAISKNRVAQLDSILYWSMIFQPSGFIVVFGVSLLIVTLVIKKESSFRMTLYLSLPEQIASDNFKSGGLKQINESHSTAYVSQRTSSISQRNNVQGLSLLKNPTSVNLIQNVKASQSQTVDEETREKALSIESLYRFSSISGGISGSGLIQYVSWMIVFFIVGALSIFGISLYSRSINSKFHGRSMMMCASELRYICTLYSSIYMEENFHGEDFSIFDNQSQVSDVAMNYHHLAETLHKSLTYGNDVISFDFREYSDIESYINGGSEKLETYPGVQPETSATISHKAYEGLGLGTLIHLTLSVIKGIEKNFDVDNDFYTINSPEFSQYNHLIIGHVMDNLSTIYTVYFRGISDVIDQSFIIALVISIASVGLMLVIFLFPIRKALLWLSGYFTLTVQLLTQVQPEVFGRTIYIKKWLLREIGRSNYAQFEGTFRRTVSPELQEGIIAAADEKMILFDIKGNFIETFSYDVSGLPDRSLKSVMPLVVDLENDHLIIESINRAFNRFIEAKDNTEKAIVTTKDPNGKPIRLTITGIQSIDNSSNVSAMQSYYSYIAILVRDVTEQMAEAELLTEKKKDTIDLMKTILPKPFAEKMIGDRKVDLSAGIGSVLFVKVDDFYSLFGRVDPSKASKFMLDTRNAIDELLISFDNITLTNTRNGHFVFIAGLFNDEQNGRTEATDSLMFAHKFDEAVSKLGSEAGIDIHMKYGLSTGGPIYCKVVNEGAPVLVTTGDPDIIARTLAERANLHEMLVDRTSYECLSSVEFEATEAVPLDILGKHIPIWAHKVEGSISARAEGD